MFKFGVRLVTTLIFLLASQKTSFAQVSGLPADSISYAWYLQSNWDSLITYRHELLDASGSDYYYLRYRIAEAYYMTGDFHRSANEFRKAVKLNTADTFALQRLAGSLFFTGRWQELSKAEKQLKNLGANVYQSGRNSLTGVSAEGAYRFSNSTDIGNLTYFSAGGSFSPAGGFGITAQVQDVKQTYYYGDIHQQNAYVSIAGSWLSGWTVFATGNLIRAAFQPVEVGALTRYFDYQTISGGVSLRRNHWLIENELAFANFSYQNNLQNTTGATWFPFGDNRLQLGAAAIIKFSDAESGYVIKPHVTTRIGPALYWSVQGYSGNVTNVIENRSSLLNNTPDLIRYRIQTGMYWYPLDYLNFFLLGNYENRREAYADIPYALTGLVFGLRLLPLYLR